MFARDAERLRDCRRRVNRLPLGSAALAGTSFPIDRAQVAKELGFEALCGNSLDAVSDRDFAVEFTAAAAVAMTHVSRFAEELAWWTNPRFAFVSLADRFCTGSSIMPQKKNPDVAELARGKTGRVNGHLVALLTLMKGQPLAYNRDNQEDKEPLFDTVDTLADTLAIMADLVATGIAVDAARMREAAAEGHATATDLADYLVRKGVPFRDAHEAVARAVRHAEARGCDLADAVAGRPAIVRRRNRRRRLRRADARGLGREPRPSGRHRARSSARRDRRRAPGPRRGERSRARHPPLHARPIRAFRRRLIPMEAKDVAFLGLGVMGHPMAGHLARAGHRVTVYNRTPDKARRWVEQHGGATAPTPAAAATNQDLVMMCVGNDDDVRAVVLGAGGRARRDARRIHPRRSHDRIGGGRPGDSRRGEGQGRRLPRRTRFRRTGRRRRTASSRSWSAATPTRSQRQSPCSHTTRERSR